MVGSWNTVDWIWVESRADTASSMTTRTSSRKATFGKHRTTCIASFVWLTDARHRGSNDTGVLDRRLAARARSRCARRGPQSHQSDRGGAHQARQTRCPHLGVARMRGPLDRSLRSDASGAHRTRPDGVPRRHRPQPNTVGQCASRHVCIGRNDSPDGVPSTPGGAVRTSEHRAP